MRGAVGDFHRAQSPSLLVPARELSPEIHGRDHEGDSIRAGRSGAARRMKRRAELVCEPCGSGKTLMREVVSDVWRQAELLLAARMQRTQINGAAK